MKIFNIFFVLILLLIISCHVPRKTEKVILTSKLKILVLNANHELNSLHKIKKLAEEIKKIEFDVILIQQVEESKQGSSDFNAIRSFAKALDWNYYFGSARYFEGKNSGNAILSLYPIQQKIVNNLPISKGRVRRSFSFGVIDVGLMSLSFISTEFDNELKSERTSQSKALSKFIKKNSDNLILLGGSFYFTEKENGIEILNEYLVENENNSNEIRIFVSMSDKIKIESAKSIDLSVGKCILSEIIIKQ